MIQRGINSVLTSSCGRLFDAVASIVGLRHEINFEGQAAMELEAAVSGGVDGAYPFEVDAGDPWTIDTRPMIRAIAHETLAGVSRGAVAAKFHSTLGAIIVEVSIRLRRAEGLNRVCLSGGTFQNMTLLDRAVRGLRQSGFEVFIHAQVPPNDGGIALGQVVIANEILRQREHHVPGHSR
jgi:hydrogenase maturation protein HypF